ncbi:MAG: sulfatase-like hydrolase/transferase, partial [Planctomycetales bacterium]
MRIDSIIVARSLPALAAVALLAVGMPTQAVGQEKKDAEAQSRGKPNIVFVLADDLGVGDVKCFGGDRCKIATPHWDRLAAEGMRFTDARVNASVCVPTRMAIMTGRYPWRFGRPAPGGPWGFLGLRFPVGQHTLGTMFKQAGYRTGYVGKWHLGTKMRTKDGKTQGERNVDYSQPIEIGPPQFGFDESFILPGSLDMYPYVFARNNRWVGKVTTRKGWSAFNRVGDTTEDFEDYKVLDEFSKQAEAFIADSAKNASQRQPFFLFFALTSPHTPTSPSPKFEGKSKLGLYGDFVRETDHCLGRILAALEANGLAENTLILAASDHGPAAYAGNIRKATFGQLQALEKKGHYSRGTFRGYKFSVYEGGLRTPLVARWPGKVKPGAVCDRLVGL